MIINLGAQIGRTASGAVHNSLYTRLDQLTQQVNRRASHSIYDRLRTLEYHLDAGLRVQMAREFCTQMHQVFRILHQHYGDRYA